MSEQSRIALVVEDADVWLELLSDFLSDCGYDVFMAKTIEDAVARLNELDEELKLIVADIRLAGSGSGLDLVEQLRRARPTIKGVVVTSHPEAETRIRAQAAGALYLVKYDLTREVFVRAIRDWTVPNTKQKPEKRANDSKFSAFVESIEQATFFEELIFR